MALFTDELFDVFEEEPEKKASSKPKKRRRDGGGGGGSPRPEREEQKKARREGAAGGTSLPAEAMEDEPFMEETDAREAYVVRVWCECVGE